jgi:hypothetical protein
MTKTYHISFIFALTLIAVLFVVGCRPKNTTKSTVEIFEQGLRAQESTKNNPDMSKVEADLFGAALIAIAWERFENCPDAAPQMFKSFDGFVSKSFKQSKSSARYQHRFQQWDIFLQNLDSALLKSSDAKHLKKNWQIRRKAIERQQQALEEWIAYTLGELKSYADDLAQLSDLSEISEFSGQDDVESLLGNEDFEELDVNKKRESLRKETQRIAEEIDGKLEQFIKNVKAEIDNAKDLSVSVEPSGKAGEWGKPAGACQQILNSIMPILELQNNTAIGFWENYREDNTDDQSDGGAFSQLGSEYLRVTALQKLRYNLWVVDCLGKDNETRSKRLPLINTELLNTEANALYAQVLSDILQPKQPNQQSHLTVREILRGDKVPLEAF